MIFIPRSGPSSSSAMASVGDLPHFHSSFPLAIEKVHPRICVSTFSPRLPKVELPASRSNAIVIASNVASDPVRDWDERQSGSLSQGVDRPCSFSVGQSLADLASQFAVMPVGKPSLSGEADALEQDTHVNDVGFLHMAGESYANGVDDTISMIDERWLNVPVLGFSGLGDVEEGLKSLQRIFLNKESRISKLFSELLGHTGYAQDFVTQKLELLFAVLVQMVSVGIWRPWENAQVAECSIGCSYTLEPQFSAPTFLQATSFDASPTGNRWEDKARIRRMMEERGIKKEPGMSRIEINGKLHTFVANDRSHPELKAIHVEIDRIHKEMREAGYDPDTRFVLHDLPEEKKQKAIQFHSERLAMCYGFISTKPRTALRIVKNLRVCGDCHTATKFMSKLTQREIIVRDAFRFHHFRNGVCSCGDYW